MRLAVFTAQFPARVSTFFARDMRALIDQGFEIEVFSLRPLKRKYWQYVPKILPRDKLSESAVHHAALQTCVSEFTKLPPIKRKTWFHLTGQVLASASQFGARPFLKSFYTLLTAVAWGNQVADGGFDHILAYWGNYSATAAMVIHQMHELRTPFSMFLHAGTDLYRNQVFLKEKLRYADNIITVCEFNRRFLENLYPDLFPSISSKIYLHHLGIDLSEFKFTEDGRVSNLVLGVGSLDPYKGFHYLLEATALLHRYGIPVKLELIGDGPQRAELSRMSRRLGIASHITFRGWLPEHMVRQAMQRATMLVHPSSTIGDAVPTVIKEAMALGTPVIASNVAGIPELLADGNCGILVPPRDPSALANAIKSLMLSPQLRREYACKARKQAERLFDMWMNGAQLASLLQSSHRAIL